MKNDIELRFQDLAIEIIKQAVRDYEKKQYRRDVVEFFLSKWYRQLCDIPAEMILKKLMKGAAERKK